MSKRKNTIKDFNSIIIILFILFAVVIPILFSDEPENNYNNVTNNENIIIENIEIEDAQNKIGIENMKSNSSTIENKKEKNILLDNNENLPVFSGKAYVQVNNNKPYFKEEEYKTEPFEKYSDLDSMGRCGVAYANICKEVMPPAGDKRGDISSVKPTGWVQKKYDGKYLYNRCHLIGYQLSDEDANELNLITGTRYFNVEGMLPFENQVDDYIEKNENNHVLYRVTPIYEGENLVASGVEMEAYSVEDGGKGVCFNVYVFNVQPGVNIDYKTGSSSAI